MSEFEDLKKIIRDLLTNRFSPKPNYTRGLLGDGLGNVEVPNKPDHSFARFNRSSTEFFEIPNHTVSPVDGWPILIGELPWQPGVIQVVDTDWSAYQQSGWGNQIGSTSLHSFTHEWPDGSPGSDVLNIYPRSFTPLRGFVQGSGSTTFFANAYTYDFQGSGSTWSGLPGVDTSVPMAALPTGQAQMLGIYLNPTSNTLAVITGTTDVFTDAFDPPRPTFPANVLPVAWVRIYGSQAGLAEKDIRDARRQFSYSIDDSLFFLLAGRSGGQVGHGGIDASDNLTLRATSNATPGDIILQDTGGFVGIGPSAPLVELDMRGSGTDDAAFASVGNSDITQFLSMSSGRSGDPIGRLHWKSGMTGFQFGNGTNNAGAGFAALFTILDGGNVGIKIAAPTAQLHIDQASTTAAQPVLLLDQADVSEEMIQFETTIGTGNAIEAIGAKTLTTTHFIKVTLPGGLTRSIPVGTIA